MPPRPRLALVTLWSGPLPSYLPLFLLTAGANRTVDFVFVADSPAPPDLPENVRWVERSLDRLVDGMSHRLDCRLDVRGGYKLIDLRPTFGVSLADLLDGYDFWGSLDCDTVLGDVRTFASDERLADHDVLCFRGRGFTHGPLTVYRNADAVNRLFELAPDWRETVSDPVFRVFDEACRRQRIAGEALPPAERLARGERVSMTDVVFSEARAGRLRLYDEDHVVESDPRRFPTRLRYERGRLYDEAPVRQCYADRALHVEPQSGSREILFYHLLRAKRDPLFHIPTWSTLPERFAITRAGVVTRDGLAERAVFHARYAANVAKEVSGRVTKKLAAVLPTRRRPPAA